MHRLVLDSSTVDGLQLYFEPASLEKIREALQLVKEGDPLRWRRLLRYMPLMVETYGGSSFNRFFGAAFIDVAKHNAWRLAGVIVHELTHAYLFGRWRVPYRGEVKERHERVCLKEELRLYRRFITAFDCDEDEGRAWLEHIEGFHQRSLVRRWWERSRWDLFRDSWRAFKAREKEKEQASGNG